MGTKKDLSTDEKFAQVLQLLGALSKDNTANRNRMAELVDMQAHVVENQGMMMKDIQIMYSGVQEMSDDLKKVREAVLYVFELVMSKGNGGKFTSQELRQSAKIIENLTRDGINALAQRDTKEALNYLAKIQSAGGK